MPEILLDLAEAKVELSFQVLNLGAMDGRCDGGPSTDPANCLLLQSVPDKLFQNRSWGGVVVEAAPPAILYERFKKRSDVVIVPKGIFPENVSNVFDFGIGAPDPPHSLDLLKIDIDSFDCDVTSSILRVGPLARNPPKLLYIDINPHIPPPFLYRTTSASQSRIVPYQGSSLQCFLDAARNFKLMHVELLNAVLVRQEGDSAGILHPRVLKEGRDCQSLMINATETA